MSQALYRKWRPSQWEQVVGQEHVVQTLRNAVLGGRVAHAYLFAGPRGTGKTTMARLLAKAVNCLNADLAKRPCDECEHCKAVNQGRFLDLIEIDAASNTSVEDVRDLRDKINFSPNQGQYKVYIVDEVHMLSTAAFNALLKTLEEPPPHAIFILATTEIHKIPATVLSRCQRHEFRRIPVTDIVAQLKKMAEAENLQVEEEALTLVARQATGSLRDAISLLDQLASGGGVITLELARSLLGTATSQTVLELLGVILEKDTAQGLDLIYRTLDAGTDPRQFARQVVDYLRTLLLIRMGNARLVDATAEVRATAAQHAQQLSLPEILRLVSVFNRAANEARNNWQPSLPLEVALVEAIQPIEMVTVSSEQAPAARTGKQAASDAPVEQAQKPEAAEEASESGLTIQNIQSNWQAILANVRRRSPNAEALLKSGKILGVKDGLLYLGYSEVLKSKMEKSENIEVISQAFKEAMMMDVPIRCVVFTGKGNAIPAGIDSDGMVATVLRDLGGEIVDIQ
jgi:DNA polymerase-3 subunit gamma/tau